MLGVQSVVKPCFRRILVGGSIVALLSLDILDSGNAIPSRPPKLVLSALAFSVQLRELKDRTDRLWIETVATIRLSSAPELPRTGSIVALLALNCKPIALILALPVRCQWTSFPQKLRIRRGLRMAQHEGNER